MTNNCRCGKAPSYIVPLRADGMRIEFGWQCQECYARDGQYMKLLWTEFGSAVRDIREIEKMVMVEAEGDVR